MTPTRAAALEAVAASLHRMVQIGYAISAETKVALDALSSLPAEEPEGGMVEVRARVHIDGAGLPWVHHSEMKRDGTWDEGPPNHIATIVARISRPVVPEVVAEVVKP